MILHKHPQRGVIPVIAHLLNPLSNFVHALLSSEDICYCVVHGVRQQCINIILVISNVTRIVVKDLSNLIHSGSLGEFFPKRFRNFRNSVNSNPVNLVLLNKVLNPVLECLSHPGVFLSQIRQPRQSAVFHLPLIVPVINVTSSVVMLIFVERVDLAEVRTDWGDVVGYYIYHHPHAFGMQGCD
jgi:hypothetical protein